MMRLIDVLVLVLVLELERASLKAGERQVLWLISQVKHHMLDDIVTLHLREIHIILRRQRMILKRIG